MGLRLRRKLADPLHNAAHRYARRALGDVRTLIFHPGHARDIEMDPWRVADELLEEHCSGDGSAPTIDARVHDVGNRRLDVLLVVVGAGKSPEGFSGATHCRLKGLARRLV